MNQKNSPKLNHVVFWPPFLLLVAAVGLNFLGPDSKDEKGEPVKGAFSTAVDSANGWVLANFSWLFTLCAFLSLILCVWICLSGFGKVRIGGEKAKPLMSLWNWFSITICTTIAIGILFWSTAEPVKHFTAPPANLGIAAGTPQAATFALSTMYLHWSFTPYAIYCVASLMFAFAYYNMKRPFSLGSTLSPLLGEWSTGKGGNVIDAVCLYSLVAGMAAALGAGILMLSGGLSEVFGLPSNKWVWAAIAAAIVSTFIVSSATGLMKGIRILSDINTKLLFGLALLAFVCGPTMFILSQAATSLLDYGVTFVPRNMQFFPQQWGKDWTVFYWAVWLAWAPVTACFLGRISYGRTVREFMLVNFLLPSIFAIVWMSIFSGTALHQEINMENLAVIANDPARGAQFVSYEVFKQFPFATAIIIFYMLSAFVCFVTSSDSNMSAMASISSSGISPDNPEGNPRLKIIWGVSVGTVAWVMIAFTGGVEGIRILSNLGGFPAAILHLLILASLARVILAHKALSQVDAG